MVQADKLAAFFGEEFAKEVKKAPLLNEYVFPSQVDKAGNNIFQKIALELIKENMKGQLLEKGYVYLDDAYLKSTNPTIIKIRENVKIEKPFQSNSAFIVEVIPKDGKVDWKIYSNGTVNLGFKWRCFNAPEYKNDQYPTVTLMSQIGLNTKVQLETMCDSENPVVEGLKTNNPFWCIAIGKNLKKESFAYTKDTKTKKAGEQGESIKFSCEAVIPFPN